VIAAIAAAAMFNLNGVDIRNGYLDSVDGGSRDELFAVFPTVAPRRVVRLDDDPQGRSEYRFWFVIRAGRPVLALEPVSALCWRLDGTSHDLMRLYTQGGRQLWPVVATVATDAIEPGL